MDQSIRAPQLESPLGWLNTERPLRIGHELAGQVVLLDFWTYCCINCIHILPDLKYLERKYRDDPLVVIGVHSAKFTNESKRQTIRSAIHRYEIEHAVIVDDRMALWRSYGVRSWPTVVVIDPEGFVSGIMAGEGKRDVLDEAIGKLMALHRKKGTLAASPLSIRRDGTVEPATGLAFPGKVLADMRGGQTHGLQSVGFGGGRVFISDSNHNRIVVTSWPDAEGRCKLIKTIGNGAAGRDDGPAKTATFDHPQGMALVGETLYVADTENHLIRAVDLKHWWVSTVLGTGEMGHDRTGGAMGVEQEISSPWDLAAEGGTLYIAMAGIHQIWRAEMPVGFARALAGSGRENIVDGPVETAALSQPSGICLHRGRLYFADSEVSAIRGVDLADEQVFTVIGEGLFVFGDVDEAYPAARLQHCLGVTAWHDKLLVADTYNHKIKVVDPEDRTAKTLYGNGTPSTGADPVRGGQTHGLQSVGFYEPGGLDVAGDTLFVADTNNHRVVCVDLKTHEWAELKISGLSPVSEVSEGSREVIKVAGATVARRGHIPVQLEVSLPKGAHVNAGAPWSVRVAAEERVLAQSTGHGCTFPITVEVPAGGTSDHAAWDVSLSFVYCTDAGGALCVPAAVAWRVPIRYEGDRPTDCNPWAFVAAVRLSASLGAKSEE
ncbi:MAG: thioredoxin-like domain-containing protein [Phycisphaerae bacterium]